MKKRRRIEIRAFRRRTTLILRDGPEHVFMEPSPLHRDVSHPASADSSQAQEDKLNPSGHAASAGQLEIPEGRKEIATRK